MEEVLQSLGLNQKEARVYLCLLEEGNLTAAEIAKRVRESRTNTYMVLEKLLEQQLVIADDQRAVRVYAATDPILLKNRLTARLQDIKRDQAVLNTALPELSSLFSLGQHKPGVIYLEGLEGLRTLLEDTIRTNTRVDLIASDEALSDPAAWELLQKAAAKRKARGIVTRGLFHAPEAKHWAKVQEWSKKGYEVRRWGKTQLPGEIVIYGNKVAFTVYQPSIVVTIMTNDVLAASFRVIFDQLWEQGKP